MLLFFYNSTFIQKNPNGISGIAVIIYSIMIVDSSQINRAKVTLTKGTCIVNMIYG